VIQENHQLLSIVNNIHDLTIDPSSVKLIQESFCSLTGAVGVHFLLFDNRHIPLESTAFSGLGDDFALEAAESYVDQYAVHDIKRVANYFGSSEGKVVSNEELTSQEEKRTCPLYNEYFPKFISEEQLIFGSTLGNGLKLVLSQARSKEHGDYRKSEREMFNLLSTQVTSAISRRQQLLSNYENASSLIDVVTDSTHALIMINASREVSWMNEKAMELVKQISTISVIRGKILFENFKERGALDKLIDQAALLTDSGKQRIGTTAANLDHRRFSIDVFSMKQDSIFELGTRNKVLLALRLPKRLVIDNSALIRAHFDFTPAETRLAAAIASGKTIREYAIQQRIKESTVRDTLKIVMHKADVRRQTNLALRVQALF